ncbi:hypothetical protein QAD02_013048 [Eretmocerus hayati]|uniref:Uncharacterized protein n=1 Tax=Eretmocerus hayati TaxID=131215 RepID=A0ACC2P367_9HYME|nr:hypothetical protein QAD02_013048 [Eretmocerus hayati]
MLAASRISGLYLGASQKTWSWIPKRYIRDRFNPMEFHDENAFRRRYKFTQDEVRYFLLPLVEADLERLNRRGLPLPPLTQLLATLRFMASGSYQAVIGDLQYVSQSSICLAVQRVSVALASRSNEFIHFPPDDEGQVNNIKRFYLVAGMTSISAVIDGCLVRIKSPPRQFAEIFRCRKGYFAINVLAAVGPDGEFLFVDVRHPGSVHDQTCLDRSALRAWFAQRQITGKLLGDNGYGNKPYLLTPVLNPQTQQQRRYNRSHIPTRNIVERAFGRWKAKFSCVKRGLLNNVNNSIAIIVATCVLWNIHLSLHHPNNTIISEEQLPRNIAHAEEHQPANMNGLIYRREFILRHF